ncbi:hypothetical protein RN001_009419 [Aquatica leii]|uniref:RRM domain-containing protein n=1 Tax=Aquatica leii TaxID=1421715 RepID=A0AAN7SMX5_9COLE|nr:hypothetical protein RN001_009419 [Aquatica leii]
MASTVRLLRLYVGNLPWTVGHNELKQYFSKYGHVNGANVVFDKNTGLSRNYGFVVYSNREGFDTALNVQNHKLEGYILKVEPSGSNDN